MSQHGPQDGVKKRKPRGKPIVRGRVKPAPKPNRKHDGDGRQSYAALPWAQIREEFETTEVSTLALTRRWGIKSDGTLRKRIAAEGWSKRVDAIAANLVQAGIAAGAGDPLTPVFTAPRVVPLAIPAPPPAIEGYLVDEPLPPVDEPPPRVDEPSPPVDEPILPFDEAPPETQATTEQCDAPAPGQVSVEAFAAAAGPIAAASEAAKRDAERRSHSGAPKAKKRKEFEHLPDSDAPRVRTRTSRRDEAHVGAAAPLPPEARAESAGTSEVLREIPADAADAAKVSAARGLADLHLKAVAEQIQNADRLAIVGNLVLAQVMMSIAPPPLEDGSPDVFSQGQARAALTFVNPERETLAGLLKTVSDMLERSAQMKRRALAMDPKTGSPGPFEGSNPPIGSPVRSASDVARLAQGLPPDILKRLREASSLMTKLPPAKRPGAAGPEPEPADGAA